MSQVATRRPKSEAFDDMVESAKAASRFLKVLSNENRLLLLCHLAEGEKSVGELELALGLRQPAISQQLARLRAEGLVTCRRAGKTMNYTLASEEARRIMELLYELFCAEARKAAREAPLAMAAAGE